MFADTPFGPLLALQGWALRGAALSAAATGLRLAVQFTSQPPVLFLKTVGRDVRAAPLDPTCRSLVKSIAELEDAIVFVRGKY